MQQSSGGMLIQSEPVGPGPRRASSPCAKDETRLPKRADIGDGSDCKGRTSQAFLLNMKNTFRVLLSREMKGRYVCFLDENTENFFRSRVES